MRSLLLLLLTACACGTQQEPAKLGDADVKVIKRIWSVPMPGDWRSSPWYRSFIDVATPAVVAIAVDDFACVLPNGDVDLPNAGHAYRCKDGWRRPSAVH